MDPITHTLAGATMARAGLDRRTPLAMATLMLAANAPDIDIAAMFVGDYTALAWRRGWTHGPIAMLVLPVLLTAAMLAWDRWMRRWRRPDAVPADPRALLLLAGIGTLSHPALDWLNTYGIRLLMPFGHTWYHGDAVFIIDPYLWVALGAGLLLPRRTVRRVRIVGATALVYVLAMVGASLAGESLARDVALAQGLSVHEVIYQPVPANPLAGDLIVVTDSAYRFGRLSWRGAERVRLDGPVILRGDWAAPEVAAARADRSVRDYLVWAQYPYVRIERDAERTHVFIGDARFVGMGVAGGLQGVRVAVR